MKSLSQYIQESFNDTVDENIVDKVIGHNNEEKETPSSVE
jgi:hypothetical protein